MTEAQVKHLVARFLGWKLPGAFRPDGGISFKPTFNEHTAHPMKHDPYGTNLFDATQAEAMVRYMFDGMPEGCNRTGMSVSNDVSAPERGEFLDLLIKTRRRDNTTSEKRVRLSSNMLTVLQDRLTTDTNIREVEILLVHQVFRHHKSFAEDFDVDLIKKKTDEMLAAMAQDKVISPSFDVV